MRWPAFLTRKQPATPDRRAIVIETRRDPLERCRDEIDAAVRRRRAKRLAQPKRGEAKRFAHARAKVDQLILEMATQPVEF